MLLIFFIINIVIKACFGFFIFFLTNSSEKTPFNFKKSFKNASFFIIGALIISSPWYLLNLFLRNSTIIHVADLDSNHPFTPANRQYDKIATVSELEEDLENRYPTFPKIGSPESNSEFISLMKIIEKFEKNGIKVIIFATPSQKLLLDNIPNEILDDFDSYFVYIDSNSNANVSSFCSTFS